MVVIWTMNKCGGRCLGKYCRITINHCQSFSHIWHFLMISYAQCVKVSLSHFFGCISLRNTIVGSKCIQEWYNGEMVHFSKNHLPYALPALFFLLTVTVGILTPILLLVYPLLNKYWIFLVLKIDKQLLLSSFCAIFPIGSLKPLLDSFQDCFLDSLLVFIFFIDGLSFRFTSILQISVATLYLLHFYQWCFSV